MKRVIDISVFLRSIQVLFFLGCVPMLFPQSQITFRQLSVKEGLSQNSTVSISQDSTGYLWIATQDGLNKYDGRQFNIQPYSFVDITRDDYSNLGKVYTDRRGDVWIVPQDRIPKKLNRQTGNFETQSSVNEVSVIFQDYDLNTWFGTYSNGLFVLGKNDSIAHQAVPASLIKGTVYNIIEDSKNNLLLVKDAEILKYNLKTAELTKVVPKTIYGEPIAANFSDIVYDEAGREWVATFGHGLYFREPNQDFYQRATDLSFNYVLPSDLNITDIHLDRKNRIWVATYGRGLYMMDIKQQKIQHFGVEENNPRALHYNDVLCIYEDYSGTLWFGTDGAGLSYYDEYLEKFNSLTNYQTPQNINIDVVRAITVDQEDIVWIGTSGKGLTRYEPKTNSWQTFKNDAVSKNKLASDRIMSLLVDQKNQLWIGSQGAGLSILDTQRQFKHYDTHTEIALSAKTVWSVFRDDKNRFWLGTREQGLIQFDEKIGEIKKFKNQDDSANAPPGNNIRTIAQGSNSTLWIGTEENGIASFDPKTETFVWYQHKGENSISSNSIKSLYEDENGILWIGTNGSGLCAFDRKQNKFYSYTVANGLANNVIYGILTDKEKNLWLSSNKGITKFTPGESMDMTPTIVNYANYDGLATEFNTGAYHKDQMGNLYFGGLEGFYWFEPSQLKENVVSPKTTITKMEVFNESRSMIQNANFEYDENTLTFSFSSLQFSLPEKNEYQYRLLNFDEEWVQSGNINVARYSQLPPGAYDFQVKSSNYDGIWNNDPVSYKFSIKAPWYLTTIAKMIYVLLFLATLFGIYSYLKWRLRMRLNLQLQEEEAERLKRLNDFKSKLYTDVSHEFRTPLTLISGPIDAKLSEGPLSDADFTNFSMIKRNTSRLIALVDQLLHLAKLEKGKLKLKVAEGDIGLFLKMLAKSFEYKAKLKNMTYTIDISNLGQALYDADALEKIITNLLSNAFKHGSEFGTCHLEAYGKNNQLFLSIKNSVAPGTALQTEKLFTRFYQGDEHSEGAGVGLSLTKELVELHQGEISVKLEDSSTIHFRMKLPIHKEAFEFQDQIVFRDKPYINSNEVLIDEEYTSDAELEPDTQEELPILLIVEDHSEVRQFIKSVWANKYNVIEAENGKEGIEKAIEIVPDIVITDIKMPICDGIELCNTLKTDERTSHIPVILLTAGIGEEQELKGLQSGADDFVTKPFKLLVLQTRVENLIATRKALRNRYSQEMVFKAKDIALTPTDTIFFNKVQKVLDEHLANPEFTVEIFCKVIGMSRMQLHRKLMVFTGLSTSAFIRSQRLKQALHILKTSDATINEVAYTVGFNTPSYFIKCFKETYKKTPLEYFDTQ